MTYQVFTFCKSLYFTDIAAFESTLTVRKPFFQALQLTDCDEVCHGVVKPNTSSVREHVFGPALVLPVRACLHPGDGEPSHVVQLEGGATLQRSPTLEPGQLRGRGSACRARHGERMVSEDQLGGREILRYAGRNC